MGKRIIIRMIFFVIIYSYAFSASSQSTDTLYLDARWRICEKPFASYYRFSKIVIDSNWYYQGRVLDFYTNDSLQMDGNYSTTGFKEGLFQFFYPQGKLQARGYYAEGFRKGIWEFFYDNGQLQLKLQYAGDGRTVNVLEYFDSTGNTLLKDRNGVFEMPVSFADGFAIYRLRGELKEGKKTGTWNYYEHHPILNKEVLVIKETYANNELKKGTIYTAYPTAGVSSTYKKPFERLGLAEFVKFKATEGFAKDPTSFRNKMDNDDLLEYLKTRKSPAFNMEADSYAQSMAGILNKLNTLSFTKHFSNPDKLYGGEVVFNLTDSGEIKDIEIFGNLDDKEKEIMALFVRKFKNIQEIAGEYAEVSKDHKIYFFTLIMGDFIPYRYLPDLPEKIFFFSPWPYRALIDRLKAKKKRAKS